MSRSICEKCKEYIDQCTYPPLMSNAAIRLLIAERDELRDYEERTATGVHSCSIYCKRAACVKRRAFDKAVSLIGNLLSLHDDPCPHDAATTRAMAREFYNKHKPATPIPNEDY